MATATAVANPELIPTQSATPSVSFPSSTSTGATTSPDTGAIPQLVPTVGSTNQSSSPSTPIPGSTAPPPPATPTGSVSTPASVSSVIPGATKVAPNANTTIAPVNPDETVASQLTTDLAAGSPYVDLAKSQALQAASARGLQNSSIAAGAGEAAAIAAALPIAQQDASTALTTQQTNQTQLNQAAQIQQTARATEEEQSQQISEQGQINYELQAQTETANINQILTQGNVNSMLSEQQSQEQIQQINQTSANTIAQINSQAQANASQDGPALQAQYLTGVTNIMTSAQQQIQAIYQTTGLSAAQQQAAVLTANQQMQENINNLAAYYASSPLWLTGQQPAPIPANAIPKAPAVVPIAPANPQPGPTIPAPTTPTLIPPRLNNPFNPGAPA